MVDPEVVKSVNYAEKADGLQENIYEMFKRLSLSFSDTKKIFKYASKKKIEMYSLVKICKEYKITYKNTQVEYEILYKQMKSMMKTIGKNKGKLNFPFLKN